MNTPMAHLQVAPMIRATPQLRVRISQRRTKHFILLVVHHLQCTTSVRLAVRLTLSSMLRRRHNDLVDRITMPSHRILLNTGSTPRLTEEESHDGRMIIESILMNGCLSGHKLLLGVFLEAVQRPKAHLCLLSGRQIVTVACAHPYLVEP
jgi:hypothetical protein